MDAMSMVSRVCQYGHLVYGLSKLSHKCLGRTLCPASGVKTPEFLHLLGTAEAVP